MPTTIMDRIPILALGKVVQTDDPKRQGRIKVVIPDLGVGVGFDQPTGWIRRSSQPGRHRVPKKNATVVIEGFMSGNSLTLFYVGTSQSSGDGSPDDLSPGAGAFLNNQEYADSYFEDFGKILMFYNAKTEQFIIKTKGGTPAQITLDASENRIILKSGDKNILIDLESDLGGIPLAMKGDTVVTTGGVGFITGGSAPIKARFPH